MLSEEDLATIKKELLAERARILASGDKTIEDSLQQTPENSQDFADQSSFESDRNFVLRMRDRERKLLVKIDEALERIENGTFGICDHCGSEIGVKRLIARPVVTLCINCKTLQEKQEKLS
jgi:DnaK suppressor protein